MNDWFRVRSVLDRIVAGVAAVLLSPVVAVLAVLIRRHDGGPAFVRVERMGKDYRPFMMWKLRSMRADGPDGRAVGPALTAQHDDRITPIGRRLRSFHLDELPQLLNVVKGDMLLLGPRPETPEFVDADEPQWKRILQIPPGIAGPTQLVVSDWERHVIADDPDGSAYASVILPVKLRIDEWYLDGCSFVRDAEVAVALLKRFLPGSQATRMRKHIYRDLPDVALAVKGGPAEWDATQDR